MMKKIVMLLAVAAMTCFSTSAFAVHEGEGKVAGNLADINIGGSMDIRSRDFQDLDMVKKNGAGGKQLDTQERVRLDVNVKAGDVQGKVTIENDWDTWGRFETPQATARQQPVVKILQGLIFARHGCSSPCPAHRSWSREAICSCNSARVGGSVP